MVGAFVILSPKTDIKIELKKDMLLQALALQISLSVCNGNTKSCGIHSVASRVWAFFLLKREGNDGF